MARREPLGATADAMSERSDTTATASTTSSEAAARVAEARARETRAWRCRAARDKLRIVDRAVEDHDRYLAELDAYERDIAEYRRRYAEIEAIEAPRRAARETRNAARRAAAAAAAADADDDDDAADDAVSVVSAVSSEDEPNPFHALGPAPTPPTPRDPMNDPIVAPDGAEGPPLFLLACAAMEGAGDEAVGLAKQLLSRGADPNSRGNRPQHGKDLPTLCLVIGALEAISDPPDEKAAMAESAAAVSDDDDDASSSSFRSDASPRSVAGGPAPSEHSAASSGGSSAAAYPELRAGTSPEARASTLKNFATAIMAAEGADVSLVGVLGPYRAARIAALTETYRDVVPYLGETRTRGAPLFLAVVAATSATTPEISELCLDLAARLLRAGADPNARGDRPGRGRRCGRELTPLAVALAAIEETAADEDRGGRSVPLVRLAATILAADGVDVSLDSEFTHAPTAEEYRTRRVAPGECGADSSRAPFAASGPPLWQAACAAAEGAGAPAVAIFRAILRAGGDADCVGSRPGHCGPGTPLLAMCVSALEGRSARAKDASWWPRGSSVAGSRVPSVLSAPDDAKGGFRPKHGVGAGGAVAGIAGGAVDGIAGAANTAAANTAAANTAAASDADPNVARGFGFSSSASGWLEAAMLAAVDASNAIAASHRDTRVAAEAMVASAVDALGISGGDDPDREVRARGDVATIISELVRAGADPNAPMRSARPRADDLVSALAYPLTLAVGLFADGVNPEALAVVRELLDAGADVNAAGVGPYPLVCPPLFAAALAIRRDVPESVDVFHRVLAAGADPSARAVFPEGSECSPLVELLHVLREGRIYREGVLGLIEALLDAGADPRTPLPEVYCLEPHPAYAAADPDDRAAPGEYLELRRAVARAVAAEGSLVADAAERAATGTTTETTTTDEGEGDDADDEEDDAAPRARLTEDQLDALVRTLSEKHGFIVSREKVIELVGRTRRDRACKTWSDGDALPAADGVASVSSSGSPSDASAADANGPPTDDRSPSDRTPAPAPSRSNARDGSSSSSLSTVLGARFPAARLRVGRCEYAPLFWALEAACGDGFDEARRAVEMIAARLGDDVDAAQGLNHHSWTEGSLTAMAVAAAIEAAGPASDQNREVTPSERERGAVERDPETRPRTTPTEPRPTEPRLKPDGVSAPSDPPVHPEIMRSSLENVERGFRDPEYAHPPEISAGGRRATRDAPETTDRPASSIARRPASSIASSTNGTGTSSSTSSSTSTAPADLRTAAALAAARAAAADVPMVVKLPDVAGRSRFRGKNRGALGASRFDRKTRAASLAAAAKSARAAAVWRGVGVRTRAGLAEEPRVRTSNVERRIAEEFAARAAVEDDDPPGDRLPDIIQALHAELDEIGAASQAGERPPRVADLERPAGGFFSLGLDAVFGVEAANESGGPVDGSSSSSRDAHSDASETRAREAERRAARLAAVTGVADFFLSKTRSVDARARNPLLAQLGHASLAPFEYTPLFAAVHGAACARNEAQMTLASRFASACLDLGADPSALGRHATVGGFDDDDDDEAEENDARRGSMRSYPLMWATAAALRSDNPARRVDDALAVVRRMLLAGADPSAVDLRVAVRPEGKETDAGTARDGALVRGRVLQLWDERALLLEVFDQGEWQRVNALRRKLAVMLGECGARTRFRASTAMDLVAARAEPHAETRTRSEAPNGKRADDDERTRWAEGVRRAREILEHGGVPSQYAVWVWPTTENERRPPEDRLVDDDPSTLASSYAGGLGRHARPREHGPPGVPGQIEVIPEWEEMCRIAHGGVVEVHPASREDAFRARATWDDEEDARLAAEAARTRTLWESTADGEWERSRATLHAGVVAVRDLLGRDAPPTPSESSESSESEPEAPEQPPSETSSEESTYESSYSFVPKAPGSKAKRGFAHTALVYLGLRRRRRGEERVSKKSSKMKPSSVSNAKTASKAGFVARERLANDAPRKPRRTSSDVLREEVDVLARALMDNRDARVVDRSAGTRTIADDARRDADRRRARREAGTGEGAETRRTERGARTTRAPPPAFGALGAYMAAVEEDMETDWTRTTRPIRTRRANYYS
jgi:hypothetical protein